MVQSIFLVPHRVLRLLTVGIVRIVTGYLHRSSRSQMRRSAAHQRPRAGKSGIARSRRLMKVVP